MILRDGSIDPGRTGPAFTGQRVSFIPALIAITSAILSFLLLPATCGTSTFGGRDVSVGEAKPATVDDAAGPGAATVDDAAEPGAATVVDANDAAGDTPAERPNAPMDSICSSPLFGFASFAAQPPTAGPARMMARKNVLFDRKIEFSFRNSCRDESASAERPLITHAPRPERLSSCFGLYSGIF